MAAKLTQIAVDHGFDGWLVNIENGVEPGKNIDVMVHFMRSLTTQMRAATAPNAGGGAAAEKTAHGTQGDQDSSYKNDGGNSDSSSPPSMQTSGSNSAGSATFSAASAALNSGCTVLWYDSVTVDGKLRWQNCLNEKNRVFFDACDGIFTNYAWKADYPSACALEASARRYGCGRRVG